MRVLGHSLKENFSFSTFLKDQLEILTEIVEAIEDGYKYIILESGVGKSAMWKIKISDKSNERFRG